MGATTGEDQNALITGINVTPLVDVVLVLLIIFMATAPLIHRRSLNVSVPKAANTEPKATATLQIEFNADKELYVDKQKIAPESLADDLRGRMRFDPTLHVSLSADEAIPYGDVVSVLDTVRGAGVKKVGLDVRRK